MRYLILKPLLLSLLALHAAPSWARQRPAPAGDFERVAAQAERARGANRIEEAIGLYRNALSLRPGWAEGWWYLGTLLYDRDAFADAAGAFDKAASLSPNAGTAWVMLGLCEFKLARYEEALRHIQRGRRLSPNAEPQLRHVMLYHEGLLLLGKGDFEHAQDTLGLLSRDGVENEDLTNALGLSVLRLRFSDLLAGDAALRELVRRAGHAEHLAAQKRFDEASDEYARLAADFPKTRNVQYAYGRYLLSSNQDEQAVEAFKREIENTPDHLQARLLIADVKHRAKDFAGGLPYAEEAVRLYPRVPIGHYFLGLLLLGDNQTARAIAELESARAGLPGEPKIYFALARAYGRANRKQDAERARETFMRLNKEAEQAGKGGGGD